MQPTSTPKSRNQIVCSILLRSHQISEHKTSPWSRACAWDRSGLMECTFLHKLFRLQLSESRPIRLSYCPIPRCMVLLNLLVELCLNRIGTKQQLWKLTEMEEQKLGVVWQMYKVIHGLIHLNYVTVLQYKTIDLKSNSQIDSNQAGSFKIRKFYNIYGQWWHLGKD